MGRGYISNYFFKLVTCITLVLNLHYFKAKLPPCCSHTLFSQARFCFCTQLENNLWQVYETISSRFSSWNILFISFSITFSTFLTGGWVRAPGSFIYPLRNNDGLAPFKSTPKDEGNQYAIRRSSGYGPTFGGGHDLYIASDAGSNTKSSTAYFGSTYNLPHGYTHGETNTGSLFGGSYYFTPSEVEVLYLN